MRISDWSSDVCSSDLLLAQCGQPRGAIGVGQRDAGLHFGVVAGAMKIVALDELPAQCFRQGLRDGRFTAARNRSEEHTSELQSLMRISYAVFCLKKKKKNKHTSTNQRLNITISRP